MMRASFAPIAATIAASTTFTDVDWPAANVLDPLRPHVRAYSAGIGSAHRLTFNFGAAVQPHVVGIIHANFLTVTIQQEGTDAWGAPDYTQAITLARSSNGRYHYDLIPSVAFPLNPFLSRQFLSLSIPAQATTDGASQFKIGIVYPGLLVTPPRDIRIGAKPSKRHAREDTKTQDGRTLDRVILDDPIRRMRATRQAADPAELEAWEEFDRQWSEAPGQAALVCWDDEKPAQCYVMRREDDDEEWTDNYLWSESEILTVEVVAG